MSFVDGASYTVIAAELNGAMSLRRDPLGVEKRDAAVGG